jgi:hypothetical protein
MKLMTMQLRSMNDTLTEAKGGWRVMMYVGGAAGSIGAIIAWIAQHLTFKGPQ